MSARNAIASVAVKDLNSAIKWYERLLARAPDVRPIDEVAEWKFAGGGWLQLCQLPKRAGTGVVRLAVRDLDEQAAHLQHCGIECATPEFDDAIVVADPDGNRVALTELNREPVADLS